MKPNKLTIFCINFICMSFQSTKINKSIIDSNVYEYHTLKNGMRVLTISNPETDKAGCSLTVKIGSQQDPVDTPGLSHFLEKILFADTKLNKNNFDQYINSYNGTKKSFTSDEFTVFYYNINSEYLENSFKLFSSIFKWPSLKNNILKRHILTIDSIFQAELINDSRRIRQMRNHCIKDEYLPNKFSCGNKRTLTKKKMKNILTKFYTKNYVANKMCLVIYGRESNKLLLDLAIKYFGKINGIQDNIIPSCPLKFNYIFKPEFIGKIIKIEPIEEQSDLIISISLPSEFAIYYQFNVYGFMTYVLAKENRGSLIYKLKADNYIISFSINRYSLKDYCEFSMQFKLTQKGLNNYLKILEIMESHINNKIYSTDENSFCLEEYAKFRILNNKQFVYKECEENETFFKRIGIDIMYNMDEEHLLDYGYLCSEYDKSLIIRILKILADRKNWLIFLVNDSMFNRSSANEIKEKYYDISYKIEDYPLHLSDELLFSARARIIKDIYEEKYIFRDKFCMPVPNEGLDSEINSVLYNGKLKYVFTNSFTTPKSCIYILLKSPHNIIIQNAFCYLVSEAFKSKNESYDFMFQYEFETTPKGLKVYFYGYNCDVIHIVQIFIDIMKNEVFSEIYFRRIKDILINNIKPCIVNSPDKTIQDSFNIAYDPNYISPEEAFTQVNELTFNDLKDFKKNVYFDMLACGNLLFEEVYDLFCDLCNSIKTDNFILPKMEKGCKYKDPIIVTDCKHSKNVYGVFFKVGKFKDYKLLSIAKVLIKYANSRFINTSRAKRYSGSQIICDEYFFCSDFFISFSIQSENTFENLSKIMYMFIEELLNSMTIEDFNISKNDVITNYEIKYKSISDWGNFLWSMKMRGYWDLNYNKNMIKYVKALNFEDINEMQLLKKFKSYVKSE
ncbi:A-factor-processing enzyme [Astathelohania contejeani]|uniref:A-factor-processing enzyme n=1 Tax=Astathelohania contejeani TaxID=164912 RepID=A0ABQ7HXT9_9MICR|nr:A-factor-processing enzyme [Thelohania contejeani]